MKTYDYYGQKLPVYKIVQETREHVDPVTGEVTQKPFGKKTIYLKKPDGKLKVLIDASDCISLTDTTGVEEADINKLVEKYSPNELANFLAQRSMAKPLITGRDLSQEPGRMETMNEVYRLQSLFNELSSEVHAHFKTVTQFLKFADDPKNVDQLIRLGLVTKKEIETIVPSVATTTPTQEKEITEPSPIKTK